MTDPTNLFLASSMMNQQPFGFFGQGQQMTNEQLAAAKQYREASAQAAAQRVYDQTMNGGAQNGFGSNLLGTAAMVGLLGGKASTSKDTMGTVLGLSCATNPATCGNWLLYEALG